MESKVRIGIRNDWPELTAIINKAIHSISKNRINALKKKWISQKGYESIFTLDELHWLSSHRVIRFTGDPIAVRLSANSLQCSFPGSAWERFPRWLCHLRTEQAAEPPRTRSQAEPGNKHRSEFALA
jgi:hypothetical protein